MQAWRTTLLVVTMVAACTTSSRPDDDDGGSSTTGPNIDDVRISEYCQTSTACQGGNALDEQACVATLQGDAKAAVVTNCLYQYANAISCEVDYGLCSGGAFEAPQDACGATITGYVQCVTAATQPASTPMVNPTVGAVCDAQRTCMGASDLDYALCLVEGEKALAVASAYGCGGEMTAYTTCVAESGQCIDGVFDGSACSGQLDAVNVCVVNASALG